MEEIQAKKPRSTNKHRMRAKLIFNPGSGATGESPVQLMDVISEMQAWKLVPEAYLVEPDSDLPACGPERSRGWDPHVRGMWGRRHH